MGRRGLIRLIGLIQHKLAWILTVLEEVKAKVAGFPDGAVVIFNRSTDKIVSMLLFYMNSNAGYMHCITPDAVLWDSDPNSR
jgi:hypothetical protein